jgi:hypothetical protein
LAKGVSFKGTSYGYWDLWIVKKLHRRLLLRLRLQDGCGLVGPFGDFPSSNQQHQTDSGEERRRVVNTVWRGHLKDFGAIFVFVVVLCTVVCFS